MDLSPENIISALNRQEWGIFNEIFDQQDQSSTADNSCTTQSSSSSYDSVASNSSNWFNIEDFWTQDVDSKNVFDDARSLSTSKRLYKPVQNQEQCKDESLNITTTPEDENNLGMLIERSLSKLLLEEAEKEEEDMSRDDQNWENDVMVEETTTEERPKWNIPDAVSTTATENPSIMWNDRNLLDLGHNVMSNTGMIQSATLPIGVSSYFEHRSQISRYRGAFPPGHIFYACSCGYYEPVFF